MCLLGGRAYGKPTGWVGRDFYLTGRSSGWYGNCSVRTYLLLDPICHISPSFHSIVVNSVYNSSGEPLCLTTALAVLHTPGETDLYSPRPATLSKWEGRELCFLAVKSLAVFA